MKSYVIFLITHLLLGRLCQFDRKAKHDVFKNKYFLKKDGRVYTLAPLSPKQVWRADKVEEGFWFKTTPDRTSWWGSDKVRKSENKVSHELEK